ncbi:MAG: flavodoxin [Eubacterium sp.]|nr:flavodoxin [Eubacterium sp.]
MNTIIVYYSMGGNTEYAAQEIAEILDADMLRIYPKKAYPSKGFLKFVWGGKSAVMAETPELEEYDFDASKYDRVIIGFPVWASSITPPIRTFVKGNDISGKHIAAFACEGGSGADKAFDQLKQAIGINSFDSEIVLIDPKDRPNEDNEQKIRDFCAELIK